ncbi:zinc finger lsd1 subclass family protein, putative, partial [Ichthyophthirius multifiliis]
MSCDQCKSGYFYDDSKCITSCPKGKYADISKRTCNNCNNKCATCSNAKDCDTCFENRVTRACECPANTYDSLDYKKACTICSTISIGCSNCNATTCLACLTTYFLEGNSCVKNCPPGKYGNTTNRQCTACLDKCATCSNATDCDTCFENRVIRSCECPANSYDSLDFKKSCTICSTISIGCSNCNATTCLACLLPYFLEGNSCVKNCPPGKYGNTTNRQCTACLDKCATCSNATDCDTCFENRITRACECPANTYDSLDYKKACIECSTISNGCSTCKAKTCQACLSPYFLEGNSCVNICPPGKYGNTINRQCSACLDKCATCSNDTDCDTCFENRVTRACECPANSYDSLDFKKPCTICSTISIGCSNCNATTCLACLPTYFQDGNKCVKVCPPGKYGNLTNKQCSACLDKCATCSNDTDCDTCFENRVTRACECPANTYDSLDYKKACIKCSTISNGCSTCKAKTCQACLSPYFLEGNSCVNICPPGKYGNTINRQCSACLDKCATCSNDTDCDTCFENRVTRACECPANSYDSLDFKKPCTICSTISIGCSNCNATTCLACLLPYFLEGNSCVKDCPPGKNGNTTNRQCTSCLDKCVTCSNATDCDTCFENRVTPSCQCPANTYDSLDFKKPCTICSTISIGCSNCNATTCLACLLPYFLEGNSCVKNCPPGKYGNMTNRQCTACLDKCATCSNATDCDTCFENRVPQQCNCPQYSYDSNVFNQACAMCSTFSTGCATCNATECLTCKSPQYFQQNQNKQCDSCQNIMTKIHFSSDFLDLIIDF